MRKIIISIALVALMLTGCSKNEGKTTAVENIATDTVATIGDASADATTEEVVEEPAPEKETLEAEVTTEVPATTEIGGGTKKEDTDKSSTTESTKPSTNHSNASSNGGSADNGQSTAPKPSNNGSNSGNSGNSNSSGNNSSSSGNNNSNNGGSSNSGNNTPQHQHNYNVWVKTKDAYDEKVIDQAAYDETIEHPEEGYWADAVQCNDCYGIFFSNEDLLAHPCGGRSCGSTQAWKKTKDAWTETKHHDAVTHTVHHAEEGYWKCECGARK